MNYLVELIVSGLVIGAVYGLIAMGFAVIYRATGVINFAQGEMGMLICYLSWSIAGLTGGSSWLLVLAALVVSVAVGWIMERMFMRPMLGESMFSSVMVTIGLAVVLRSLVILVWGTAPKAFTIPAAERMIHLGGIGLRLSQIGIVVVLVAFIVATWLFFKYSRLGIAMRAASADDRTARLMGVSTARVQSLAWMGSALLAGTAGIFFALIYSLAPDMYQIGLKAFPATVLGGLDAIIGSGISGYIIGITENLTGGYAVSALKEVSGFILIIVVLMIRPFGLFGEPEIERV